MPHLRKRLRIEAEDWLRASIPVREALARYKLLSGTRAISTDPQAIAGSIVTLCEAARLATSETLVNSIEKRIQERVSALHRQPVDWAVFLPGFQDGHIPKAAVLKPHISAREKGVVLINYEGQYVRLLRLTNLKEFAERYTLVVGPSWHPPHSLVNCVFPEAYPGTVFSLISNVRELEILPRLSPKFAPLPLYGSSWVNPSLYQPLPPNQRDIDILMVANWGKFKRHFALFQALRRMPEDLRIVLIGQNQDGRTSETIRQEACAFGVQDRFTLRNDLSYPEVVEAYCRARTSVILSRREGSCVAIAESLFADTPAALYEDAMIGSKAFINSSTGKLLKHRDLASQLLEFLAEAQAGRYAPRAWAETNISCFRSASTMNDILKKHALAVGQEWTRDVAPVTWCPDQQLASPEDRERIAPEYEIIQRDFGITLGDVTKPAHQRAGGLS
jgi:glycosyltransferase involved in cell wall biosynthesis